MNYSIKFKSFDSDEIRVEIVYLRFKYIFGLEEDRHRFDYAI